MSTPAHTKNYPAVLMMLFMAAWTPGFVHAGGQGEDILASADLPSGDKKEILVQTRMHTGSLECEVRGLQSLIRGADCAGLWYRMGNKTWHLERNGLPVPANLPEELAGMVDSQGLPLPPLLEMRILKGGGLSAQAPPAGIREGLPAGSLLSGLVPLDRLNAMFRDSRDRLAFSLPAQGVDSAQSSTGSPRWTWDATCWLVLGNAGTGSVTILVSTLDLEFFEGEKELLENSIFPPAMAMANRSMSLLWAVLADSYDNAGRSGEFDPSYWRTTLASVFSGSPWYAGIADFPSLAQLQTLYLKKSSGAWPHDLQTGIDRFKTAVLTSFIRQDTEGIASSSRNLLYIQFFLRLCLAAGKPLCSRDLADNYLQLRESESSKYPTGAVFPPEYRFDYRNYRPLNPYEGKNLARAACKYLAWGIQAPVLRKALETLRLKPGADRRNPGAYPELQTLDIIDGWLEKTAPGLEALVASNYYQGSTVPLLTSPDSPLLADLLALLNAQLGDSTSPEASLKALAVPEKIPPGALAWSPFGVDSPRTWAYKLLKNMEYQAAWNAIPHNPAPFEPPFTEYRNKSSSQGIGLCSGIDGPGFLGGSLVMAGLGNQIFGFNNQAKLQALDSYYRFSPDPRLGRLQLDGLPASLPGVNTRALGTQAIAEAVRTNDAEYRKDSNRLRLSFLDLENSTMRVPDPCMARIGDLVCQQDERKPDEPRIGIIAAINGTLGRDSSLEDIFSRVLVLGLAESGPGSGVTLASWGSPDRAGSFSLHPEKCSLRRLLVRKAAAGPADADRYPGEPWDFISAKAEGFAVKPVCFDESGKSDSGWRWIPDTGEYLVFEVHVEGLYPNRTRSRPVSQTLRFIPPEDRNWSTVRAENNVDNNRGSGFEIVALEGTTIHPVLAFSKKDGSDRFSQYRIDYTWSGGNTSEVYDSTGKAKTGWNLGVDEAGKLSLQTPRSSTNRFGIRPLDPRSTCPGDDLILRFCAESGFDRTTGTALPGVSTAGSEPSSYMATYDKKMLWRANLYLDEGPEMDWNNLHPWNAPPGPVSMAGNIPDDGIPWWAQRGDGSFDDSWGYNEWNRQWDGSSDSSRGFPGLTALGAGNGRQVISLPAFTPLRTLGASTETPDDKNLISGTVAYSYPFHKHEPFQADQSTAGDAGSQDSPFDFIKKMLMQKQQLADSYNENGERFARPRSKWPVPDATDPGQFADQNSWLQNARFLLPADMADFTAWQARNTDKSWYEYPAITSFSLKPWDRMQAPKNSWWYYQTVKEDNWDKSKPTSNFLPGLGLKILTFYGINGWQPSSAFDEKINVPDAALTPDSYLNAEHVIEAGTDCIGLVQRAMSWKFNSSVSPSIKNNYRWEKLDNGITEARQGAGDENIWWVFGSADLRRFPIPGGSQPEAADTIVHTLPGHDSSTYMKSESWTAPEKENALKLLKKVVPGDIWVKDSGDTNTLWDNHIAIIASVPENPESFTDPQEFMNNMGLIEAEFTNKIQSVINSLSVGMYNKNVIPKNTIIYMNDLVAKDGNKAISLNTFSWAIRRLK